MNHDLFLFLNAGDDPAPFWIGIAYLLAVYAVLLLPLKLVFDWLWGTQEDRRLALGVLMALVAAGAVNLLIGAFWYVPRPAEAGIGHCYLAHAADSSFPSDHATVLFAALWVYALARRLAAAAMMLVTGVAVGWARIYLGVHFPLDIMGALVVGLIAAVLSRGVMGFAGSGILLVAQAIYRRLFSPMIRLGWFRN